jgi:hypothetical protein
MTLITGTFKDSGGSPIASGALRVRLDAPLIDFTTTPDSLHTRQPREFPIVNGSAGTVNLPQSQTQQITYEFTLISNSTSFEFYFPDGTAYTGPTFQHTDSKWYTGLSFRVGISLELDRVAKITPTTIDQFHAIVPDLTTVEYALIRPSRVTTDGLPLTIRQVAELLTTEAGFIQQLRGGPRPKGAYSPTIYYARDDQVEVDGSSWIYINPITTVGNAPPVLPTTSNTYWQLLAARGATGTGTAGNSTAYNATTWNGQTDAPSRGAVRNIIETLAKLTDIAGLAPLLNPVFGGNPSRSTPPSAGDNSSQLPTTNWVRNYAAPLDSPALLNNPSAPTQSITDRSTKLATTGHVANRIDDALGATVIASQSAAVALTSGSWIKIPFDTEIWDPSNQFSSGNFTPLISDHYRITLACYFSAASAITLGNINLYTVSPLANVQLIGFPAIQSGTAAAFYGATDAFLSAGTAYAIYVRIDGTSPSLGVSASVPCRLSIQRLRA